MRGAIAGVGLALVAALGAVGCSSILGDFTLASATADDAGDRDGSPNDATIGSDSATPDAAEDAPNDGAVLDGSRMDAGLDAPADTAPSCTSPCSVGERQCTVVSGGESEVQSCTLLDAGCTAWVATACGAGQTCATASDGGVGCACAASLCSTAGPTCTNGNSAVATCATDPTTGCLDVTSTTSCPANESCGGVAGKAACSKTCTDSCTAGESECVNGNLAQCTTQANTCLGFGAGTACPDAEQTCVASGTTASCVCQNPAACDGVTGYTCTQGASYVNCTKDTNGCLVATNATCSADATCSGKGSATEPCTCNLGYTGNGQTCTATGCVIGGKYYPNGTLNPANGCESCQMGVSTGGWSNVSNGTSCGPSGVGEICTAGACGCPASAPTLCGVMCMPAGTSCATAVACTSAADSAEANELALDGTTAYWADGDSVMSCALGGSSAAAATYVSFPRGKLLYSFYVTATVWDGAGGIYYGVKPTTETFTQFYWDPSPTTSSENDDAYDNTSQWIGLMASDSVSRDLFFQESDGIHRLDVTATDPDGGYPDSPCIQMVTPAIVAAGGGWVTAFDSGQSSILGASASSTGCGTQSAIASGSYVGTVTAIANDGAGLAFANASGVYYCPITGCGSSPTPIAATQGTVDAIALDANFVYWVGTPGLVACARSGCNGTPTVIVSGVTATYGLGLDTTHVYYFDETTGDFDRVVK